jgi:NAD(P)-dependent dehydrogenase (short-subunit alcohol dehydrogenase family)
VLVGKQPIQRAGIPLDIAHAALWLASDESSFVNGHALVVDGGLSCGQGWTAAQQRRALLRSVLGAGA